MKWTMLIPTLALIASAADAQWKEAELIAPATLAAQLKAVGQERQIVYVGFPILYKSAHIPGAPLAGPCSKPEGLDLLSLQVKGLSHDTEIVIYCGCCPLVKCPNVRPAFQALHDMGFQHVRVLDLTTSLHTDWIEKGYPTERVANK